jgi:hypothetical protein
MAVPGLGIPIYGYVRTPVKGLYTHIRVFLEPLMAVTVKRRKPAPVSRKENPINVEYEERAQNLIRGELKSRGLTYADLAKALGKMGIEETEQNLIKKVSRGGFSSAFLIQVLDAIGAKLIRIAD